MDSNIFSATVKVKRILFSDNTNCIFVGETMVPYKRKTGYKATGETHVYGGPLRRIITEDIFSVEYSTKQTKHGENRFIVSYHREFPGTLKDISEYLISRRKGVGEKRTRALVNKWGLNTLSEIVNNPDAFENTGIPKKLAQNLRSEIMEERVFEELMGFLRLHNLDHQLAVPVFNEYGESALDILKTNPYSAYLPEHIDFQTADYLFLYTGAAKNSSIRVSMTVLETIRRDSRRLGNLYMSKKALKASLPCTLHQKEQPFTDAELDAAIADLTAKDLIIVDSTTGSGDPALYLAQNYHTETGAAELLSQLVRAIKTANFDANEVQYELEQFQRLSGYKFAAEQVAAVHAALESPVSIITGGPGTGKSQTVNTIIRVARELEPGVKIKLAAPTGKAANRMTELCGLPAVTIHRLLGLGDGYIRELGKGELTGEILIVDEYSMVDAELNYKLLRAINPQMRLVIVGDYDQIPSVGPGLILRDLIASERIPCVKLTKVFRQADQSKIITNANRIMGKDPTGERKLSLSRVKSGDFFLIREQSSAKILDRIVETVQEQMKERNLSVKDIQVLSPLKAPETGVIVLNNRLQEALNPNATAFLLEEKEFRIGDKVIHVVNNYKKKVFNGETGIVKSIDYAADEVLTVAYPDKEISYTIQELEQELELAYAISVHKAQGSEFPVIVMPIHPCLISGLNRNILYTAITRARTAVYFIGDPNTLVTGIQKDGIVARNSYLKEKIRRLLPYANRCA